MGDEEGDARAWKRKRLVSFYRVFFNKLPFIELNEMHTVNAGWFNSPLTPAQQQFNELRVNGESGSFYIRLGSLHLDPYVV